MASPRKPILIIGAGIAGLAFAQGLRKKGIPFLIFERDASAYSRSQGWALTIHFALPYLVEFLPADIATRLGTTQIDATIKHDQSPSVFLNLDDCSTKWSLPPTYGNRMRVARGRLRDLLIEGLEPYIRWGKNLSGFEQTAGLVRARFDDGSGYEGELLVGIDGCHSRVRSLVYGRELATPTPIPARFLGTQALATEDQMRPLLRLQGTLFQGCHPVTPTWMWFSVMERPDGGASSGVGEPLWRVQICLSWLSGDGQDEVPKSDRERVLLMREKSSAFHPTFKSVFQDILPLDHETVINVPLEIWWLPQGAKPQGSNRVLLAGDAAHTMPLYRGEGFNHALMDVHRLLQLIEPLYNEAGSREAMIGGYEDEVRERGQQAARMCRDSCLEVHQWKTLGDDSVVRQKGVF